MKPLSLYQAQLVLLNKQRRELDGDIAQVLAEGLIDGHSVVDLLSAPAAPPPPPAGFDL